MNRIKKQIKKSLLAELGVFWQGRKVATWNPVKALRYK
jgi:hypothetical protein